MLLTKKDKKFIRRLSLETGNSYHIVENFFCKFVSILQRYVWEEWTTKEEVMVKEIVDIFEMRACKDMWV